MILWSEILCCFFNKVFILVVLYIMVLFYIIIFVLYVLRGNFSFFRSHTHTHTCNHIHTHTCNRKSLNISHIYSYIYDNYSSFIDLFMWNSWKQIINKDDRIFYKLTNPIIDYFYTNFINKMWRGYYPNQLQKKTRLIKHIFFILNFLIICVIRARFSRNNQCDQSIYSTNSTHDVDGN